jgi:hypothetical protein
MIESNQIKKQLISFLRILINLSKQLIDNEMLTKEKLELLSSRMISEMRSNTLSMTINT